MRRLIPAAVLFLLITLTGCGAAAVKCSVGGTVLHGGEKMTWPNGGSLLVIFIPEDATKTERYSARETDTETSTYKIVGIPPGRYKVAVQQFFPTAKTNYNDVLGGRYDPGHTDHIVEVKSDGQVLDIDIPKTKGR